MKEKSNLPPGLRQKAAGHWPEIFDDLAKDPKTGANKLEEAQATAPFHVPCPVHGGTDGFRLFQDYFQTGGGVCNSCGAKSDGFRMLAWVNGWSEDETVSRVEGWLGIASKQRRQEQRKRKEPQPIIEDPEKAYAKIREAWKGSVSIVGSPAEKYLQKRGIWKGNIPSGVLRAHPGLRYFDMKEKKSYGTWPALLAPIRNIDNEIVSLHRIFLTEEGDKAPVPKVKKMMSPYKDVRGAAVRLYPAKGEVLGIAEGIETALAVHAISRMPVWSAIAAPLLEQVKVPSFVKHVVVWADLDSSGRGEEAANKLADLLEPQGIRVEIMLPRTWEGGPADLDWLDVLNLQGVNGFPARWRVWRPEMGIACT